MNIIQKILAKKTQLDKIEPGQLINMSIDMAMVHDYFAHFCIDKFYEMGFSSVGNPNKVVFVMDHEVPSASIEESENNRRMYEFATKQGIKRIHFSDGVSHQIIHELGYISPGDIVVGTDSHTTTYGALGIFSTGIGYTEMAAVFGTGQLWFRVPSSLKFIINGTLSKGVYAKDVILKIIGDIGVDGATYKTMEFSGSTIRDFSVSSRLTLCNMVVEAGAKNGIIEVDEKTIEYLKDKREKRIEIVKSDSDVDYERIYQYNAEEFEPVVACPHSVDNVKSVKKVEGLKIDAAFIGSCTNGRLEDLRIAANILKGNKVSKYTRLIVTPASRSIYLESIREGIIDVLLDAGAIITHPSCSLCAGAKCGGILGDRERVISTSNRNFIARMGSKDSEVYLTSPATVAMSAISGRITSPST
ncbi:MAG: 3-isopropylmalate dehydratase large subunit [bacterium]